MMHERGRTPSLHGVVERTGRAEKEVEFFSEMVESGCLEADGHLTEKARKQITGIRDSVTDISGHVGQKILTTYSLGRPTGPIYYKEPESGLIIGTTNGRNLRVIRDGRMANMVEDLNGRPSRDLRDRGPTPEARAFVLGGMMGAVAIFASCRFNGMADSDLETLILGGLSVFGGGISGTATVLMQAAVQEIKLSGQVRDVYTWREQIATLLNETEPLFEIDDRGSPLPDGTWDTDKITHLSSSKCRRSECRADRARTKYSPTRTERFWYDIERKAGDLGVVLPSAPTPYVFAKLIDNTALIQHDPHYLPAVVELLEARQQALEAYDHIKARVRAARARQSQGVALRADKKLLKRGLSDENANNPFGKDEMGEVNRRYQQAWLKFIDTYAHVQHSYHFNQLRAGIAEMLPPVAEEASPYEFPVVRVIWDELSKAMSEITESTRENVALLGDIKDTIATLPKTLPFAELYELYEKIYYKFAPRLRTLMTPSEFRRTYPGVADGVV